MPDGRSFSWGKVANILRSFCSRLLDEYPQLTLHTSYCYPTVVYKYLVLPFSSMVYASGFPRAYSPFLYPLRSIFSPQSTIPITITTK